MKIENCTALVTDANRGVGRALVSCLLAAGAAKVYAAARDLSKLNAVKGLDPARVVPVKLDVTDPSDIEAAAGLARDVTVLFNNAGTLEFGALLDTPIDAVQRMFEVNVYGPLHMARAFAPIIAANGGGAIVDILSVVALASMPGLAAYSASKAAAWSMTQALRASLDAKGVAVHSVFPGPIDTDMAAGIDLPKASPIDAASAILAGIEADEADIFPDPMSDRLSTAWRQDPKGLETRFAAM